jgi:hypothetical protein
MSKPHRSRFSILSRAATLAISLAALGACAPLAQARPLTTPAPATMQWGFASVTSADIAAPVRAGFGEVAQAASEPVRAGFSTTAAGAAASWGFASLPATQPQASPPIAARAGSDAGTH